MRACGLDSIQPLFDGLNLRLQSNNDQRFAISRSSSVVLVIDAAAGLTCDPVSCRAPVQTDSGRE